MPDVIVIGGGVNGLITAALLGKEKLSTLVLERRPVAGGAAVTTEIARGFRVPQLSHAIGPLRKDVVRALRLDRVRDLEFLTPDPSLTTLGLDGGTIAFHPDQVLTAASINQHSPRDAGRWRAFVAAAQRTARLTAEINRLPPPVDAPLSMAERWQWLQTGRRARGLGRATVTDAARWTAMPVRDLLNEWFEDELLKAAIAARGIFGTFTGPRSPGTGGIWLQRMAEDPSPVGSGVTVRGGPGALSAALEHLVAASGGEVRTNARVARITVRDGTAAGVVLDSGEEIEARVVVAAIDPRQALLQLIAPDELAPSFLERMRHYRARGVTAKINLALASMPAFPALTGDPVALRGRLLIAPNLDYLERAFDAAKYGTFSAAPWLEIAVPSVNDPSLAPEGQHVMSIYVHFAPRELRGAEWRDQRDALFDAAMRALAPHAPGIAPLILAREVLTPEDMEREWGLTGGQIFHGDPTLDQSWAARPLLGWSRYRTPIDRLFLAGAGTHPGGGLTGGSARLAAEAVLKGVKAIKQE
jgi:phytoene dehydrogenase-like protein